MKLMKRLFLGLCVLCLAFVVTACPAGAEGEAGSIFRVTQAIMPRWDPAVGSDYASGLVLINVYDSLVFPTPDGGVRPWVAESWNISEDGLIWDFKIREDIVFHSGNRLTAQDVVYSMQRLLGIGEGFAFLFYSYVDSIEATGDYSVRLRCKTPYGPLLNSLVRFYVVDRKLLEQHYAAAGDYGDKGDWGRAYLLEHDAGSGPWTIDGVSTNISVSGSIFRGYWAGFEAGVPEKFIVYASNEAVRVKTMMSRQELECADHYQTTENIQSMLDADNTLKLAHNYTGGGLNLWLNNQKAPVDDPKIREALGYLIDYATLCSKILPDSIQKKSIVSSNALGYKEVFSFSMDFEKAKQAVAGSRYADRIGTLPIELVWNSESADREKVALMIQATASQIGLNVSIVELPWSTIVSNSARVETSPMTAMVSVTPPTSDSASQFVSQLRTKTSGTWENMNWVNDPALDEMIDKALATVDIAKRAVAYSEIQEYCAKRFTFIPLTETPERLVYQASYVDLAPKIGLQGFSFYLRDVRVYPDRRKK
ncbi:MAG: ABC transporter substrate-binding protein [Synergistaceae bacterium]|jgi:peptide/nickel transport system substrate-binding protein|nr:ABC transporter substrate-binding protein [Synergistaceae bacterium]